MFQRAGEMLVVFFSHERTFDGIRVGFFGDKKDLSPLYRVADALMLIKQHDIRRYKSIRRDIGRIWVWQSLGHPGTGDFSPTLNRCRLREKFVRSAPLADIASTIVHEAAHANPCLRKLGYDASVRSRIEKICMRQQLAFARRLPDGGRLCEQIQRGLARKAVFWSDEAVVGRFVASTNADLQEIDASEWFVKIARVLLRWKVRRTLRKQKIANKT